MTFLWANGSETSQNESRKLEKILKTYQVVKVWKSAKICVFLYHISLVSSLILNIALLYIQKRTESSKAFEATSARLNSDMYDPVILSEKISIFNHSKHRDVKCRYFTPSFNISAELYPELSTMLKEVNFNRYNQYYNIGVHLINTLGSDRRGQRVLEVSGSNEILRTLIGKKNHFRRVNYPDYNVLSLHKRIPSNKYDWVILDQVLEHVENPFQAILQLWRVLKPGGRLLLMVPSFYVYHYGPWDYWRLNCDSLKVLVAPFDRVELCGSYRSQDFVHFYLNNWPLLRKSNTFNPWKDDETARILSAQPSTKHLRWERSSPKPYGNGSPVYGDYIINSWIIAQK